MRFLLLTSDSLTSWVTGVLRDAGHLILNPGHWSSRSGPYPDGVEAVVTDHNAPKRCYLRAGFYRGSGLPVVYLTPDRGESQWEDGVQFARLGGAVVRAGDFAQWLKTGAYLTMRGPAGGVDEPSSWFTVEDNRPRCMYCRSRNTEPADGKPGRQCFACGRHFVV